MKVGLHVRQYVHCSLGQDNLPREIPREGHVNTAWNLYEVNKAFINYYKIAKGYDGTCCRVLTNFCLNESRLVPEPIWSDQMVVFTHMSVYEILILSQSCKHWQSRKCCCWARVLKQPSSWITKDASFASRSNLWQHFPSQVLSQVVHYSESIPYWRRNELTSPVSRFGREANC